RRRCLGKHCPIDCACALDHQREQNPHQEKQAYYHRKERQGNTDAVHQQALAINRIHFFGFQVFHLRCTHYFAPSLRAMPISISLAADSTRKVIANRIRPSANSDDTCKTLSASANSLASVDAILLPAANSD